MNEALSLLQAAQYWLTDDGIDNWIINNVRVSQTSDGLVRLRIIMLRKVTYYYVHLNSFINYRNVPRNVSER